MQTLEDKLERPQQDWCDDCKKWNKHSRVIRSVPTCSCGKMFKNRAHPLTPKREKAVKKVLQ